MLKSVYDDIHSGVAITQNRIKLEAWWPGYSRDVEKYIKRCKKCKEFRDFTQTTFHSWPREVEPWNRVHMDHAYITGVGLLFILLFIFFYCKESVVDPITLLRRILTRVNKQYIVVIGIL